MASMASMASSKRKIPFQHKWLLIYGLEICTRDAKTSSGVSLRCRFCEFGREGANGDGDGEERKRKRTMNESRNKFTASSLTKGATGVYQSAVW